MVKYFLLLALAIRAYKVYATCDADEWNCDDGTCISKYVRCDGQLDCIDKSDETLENCQNVKCPRFAFHCAYGACIAGSKKCDGVIDCIDRSDELPTLCGRVQTSASTCDSASFQCDSGECIEKYSLCDGEKNCPDGSDENLNACFHRTCPNYSFRCAYGACVAGNSRCNGAKDCADGSDEVSSLCGYPPQNTTNTNPKPSTTYTTSSLFVPNKCLISTQASLITKSILDMKFKPGTWIDPGTLVKYQCERGFSLSGFTDNVCTAEGWKEQESKCTKSCSSDAFQRDFSTTPICTLNDITVRCDKNILPGTQAKIECSTGYKRPLTRETFASTMICQEDGFWHSPKPFCSQICGTPDRPLIEYSMNGQAANVTDAPWHVSIYNTENPNYYTYICGGTIISARVVVSAAHCFWDKASRQIFSESLFVISAGNYYKEFRYSKETNKVEYLQLDKIDVHPLYDDRSQKYYRDLAIIVLRGYLKFSDIIKPICLEHAQYAGKEVKTNQSGFFTAWGTQENDDSQKEFLQRVDMKTLSFYDCLQRLKDSSLEYDIPEDKFCIASQYKRTACRGDSGGGFVLQDSQKKAIHYLVGLISHAPSSQQECAREGIVALTNVRYYRELLEKYIDDNSVLNL